MTLNLPGIIVAILIAFIVGILVGYALLQRRLRHQEATLKENQRRLEELERSYEVRLKETTQQLRHDHETELMETIAHHQDQLSDRILELQQNYETRLKVIQQGLAPLINQEAATKVNLPPVTEEPKADPSQQEVTQLRRRYEKRLKEAAQKLQQAYEKQLAQHVKTVTAELQADYEQRLTAKIEHYDEQFAIRTAQLEAEYAAQHEALSQSQPIPTPDEVIGELPNQHPSKSGTREDVTVTLQPMPPSNFSAAPQQFPSPQIPSPQMTEAEIDARIEAATQKVRQDYEQQLSTKLREYQRKLTSKVQELEDSYQERLNVLTNLTSESNLRSETSQSDDLDPLDLSDISQLT